jgi:hypothetical protein
VAVDALMDGNSDLETLYHHIESIGIKLLERPKLVMSLFGVGLLSCSVYIALGAWWFAGSSNHHPTEAVNLLNMAEPETKGHGSASTLNNIHALQQDTEHPVSKKTGGPTSRSPHEPDLLAQAEPQPTPMPAPMSALQAPEPEHEPIKDEATGRPDPFSPLFSANGSALVSKPEDAKKDVLEGVRYTGFIGDLNSKDKVAIIRVSDSVTGTAKTWIKKVGEKMTVNGETVWVKAISKRSLSLHASGEFRQLSMQEYQVVKPEAASGGSPASGGNSAGGNPAFAGNPGFGGNSSGANSNNGRSDNKDTPKVRLQEPNT